MMMMMAMLFSGRVGRQLFSRIPSSWQVPERLLFAERKIEGQFRKWYARLPSALAE